MRKLRIVFMGTPEFAVTILDEILKNNFNVVGVITSVDKPAGRGRKLHQSAIKKYALKEKLPLLQPKNLKSKSFADELKALKANLQVVVAFRMLPKVVWQMPEYGTFNLHASLLPEYRGAAPINWAIINGETKTGVTTFFIDEKIDTGKLILQKEVAIKSNDTAGDLHDKLMISGSDLVVNTINKIKKGKVNTIPQPNREHKKAPKIYKESCKIDWNNTLNNIYNKVRGLSPYPVAWTNLINNDKQIELKIYACEKVATKHSYNFGAIITTKKELNIAVKGGFIKINELQISGKRKMDTQSFLNGFTFHKEAKVI